MPNYQLSEDDLLKIRDLIRAEFVRFFDTNCFTVIRNPQISETAYQKTEKLLKNYTGFKRVIQDKRDTITDLRNFGAKRNTTLNMTFAMNYGAEGLQTREEETDSSIRYLEEEIQWMEGIMWKIDKALEYVKQDEPDKYTIIPRYYFDNETMDSLAESFGVSRQTMIPWRRQLVNKIAMYLFPKDTIIELME